MSCTRTGSEHLVNRIRGVPYQARPTDKEAPERIQHRVTGCKMQAGISRSKWETPQRVAESDREKVLRDEQTIPKHRHV